MEPFPIAAPPYAGDSRQVPSGNAFEWLKSGWATFIAAPGVWVVITLIMLIGNILLSMIPILGQVASLILMPMLTAGTLRACRRAGEGQEPAITDLFWAFQNRTGPLAAVGLLYTAGLAALTAATFVVVGGGAFAGALFGGKMGTAGAVGGGVVAGLVAAVIVLVASVPLFMAVWFAPALVAFNDMAPVAAMRASFFACLRNIWPITVFSLVFMVAAFFATLPAGLGWLLLLPVVFGALYASYRDIFPAT